MDDLADARAYFEKEYRAESTLFNGSKIAAGQYRRYADAVAQAAIKLGTQADLLTPLAQSIGIVRDRDHYKARCARAAELLRGWLVTHEDGRHSNSPTNSTRQWLSEIDAALASPAAGEKPARAQEEET